MAWDRSRPVNWTQLVRSWLLYVGVMALVFAVAFRDQPLIGVFIGLLVSGPLYFGFGWVMAKFGYQRKTWSDLRSERSDRESVRSETSATSTGQTRPKPAPTRRTGGVAQRPTGHRKRR